MRNRLYTDLKLIKKIIGKKCFNNEVMNSSTSQNGQNKMKMRNYIFVESLDLVLCILLIRMCIVNIPISQIRSEFVKKAHSCLR